MVEENSFYQLLLITGLAFFVPIVVSRAPGRVLPVVVGEIIAGIVIGTSGFDVIDPTPILDFLAEFGFAYLMFLSGLELDPTLLTASAESGKARAGPVRSLLSSPLGFGLATLLGTFAVAFSGVLVLELVGLAPDLWLTTLILSTTSVGVVVPTLKESGIANRSYVQSILVSAFVADFVTLLLISAFAVVHREGPTLELALVLALPLAFLLVYRLGSTLSRSHILSRTLEELSHATAQLRVRGALALMIAFVVLAETIGSELILGSFIAGVIIALLSPEEGTSIRLKLDAIGYGFFIPIFFINVGVGLDLGALSEGRDLALFPLLLLIAYLAKFVPALLLRLRFTWVETLAGGVLLSSRLSLIIAASIIGQDLGLISPGVNSAIVLIAVITSTLSPIVFAQLQLVPAAARGGVIIAGAGETGRSLAVRLAAHGLPVTLIESDHDATQLAVRDGFAVIEGQADAETALERAGAGQAFAVVATTDDDQFNFRVCRLARDRFGVAQAVARVSEADNLETFSKAGVRPVSVSFSTSAALENAVLRPSLFQILVERPQEYDVREVRLRNREFVGKALKDIRLGGNTLVLLVRREGELVVPRASTVLEDWDNLTIAGDPEAVREAAQTLSRP